AITVSNAGMFNVSYMTPIINPPQSAILGVGSIREVFRPDDNGQPELRREMGLVLAADHRLHDGAGALVFLNRIIDALQQPHQLLRSRALLRRG
ncbi:dihydrolipoamide acyltransferase, partial [Marinobacter sp. Z-F4-2]